MWTWTEQREEAAALCAADEITDQAIADKIGITKRSLMRWKAEPVFAARIADIVAEWRQAVRKRGVAVLENRVDRLNSSWADLRQVVAERRKSAIDQKQAYEVIQQQLQELTAEAVEIEERQKARQSPFAPIPNEVEEARAADDVDRLKKIRDQIRALEYANPGPVIPGQLTGAMIREVTYTKAGEVEKWGVDTPLLAELRAIEQQAAKELGQWTDNVKHSGAIGSARVDLSKLPKKDLDELERIVASATVTSGDPG